MKKLIQQTCVLIAILLITACGEGAPSQTPVQFMKAYQEAELGSDPYVVWEMVHPDMQEIIMQFSSSKEEAVKSLLRPGGTPKPFTLVQDGDEFLVNYEASEGWQYVLVNLNGEWKYGVRQ